MAVHEEARVQTEISQDENIAAARESPDELATQNPTSMQVGKRTGFSHPSVTSHAIYLPESDRGLCFLNRISCWTAM